jgi:FkbM family methyltransferase
MSAEVDQQLAAVLRESVESVIERERRSLDRILAGVDGKVVLFGLGSLGRRALRCLREIGVEPVACSDNNEQLWASHFYGLEVLPPSVATGRFGASAAFFVTIWTAQHRFVETRRQLQDLGASIVWSGAPIYWRFSDNFLPYFAQDLPHKVYAEAREVLEAGRIWGDQPSSDLYLAQIRWRALGDYDGLPPHEEHTYFPHDLFDIHAKEAFIDCGAFDGDTLRAFLARCEGRFQSIVAIEPDRISFTKLQSYISGLPVTARSGIRAVHGAVGATNGVLRFQDTGDVTSRSRADGDSLVPSNTLSAICESQRVSLIKMDIEGAEFEALEGAAPIIARDHPILAVCVYHRQDDLWRLPLLIRRLGADYRLFLRMYESEGWQTVAYAVPPERLITKQA